MSSLGITVLEQEDWSQGLQASGQDEGPSSEFSMSGQEKQGSLDSQAVMKGQILMEYSKIKLDFVIWKKIMSKNMGVKTA